MANKKRGNPETLKQIEKVAKPTEAGLVTNRKKGNRFVDKKADFESFISGRDVSEATAMQAIGMNPSTLEKYKQKHPEYAEHLAKLKLQAKAKLKIDTKGLIIDMINTGITPVGELSPRDYMNHLQWFGERYKEVKDEFQKTEHKVLEVIKDVPDHIKSKVMDVFEEVEIVEEEDVTHLEDK